MQAGHAGKSDVTSSPGSPEPVPKVALPQGFKGVAAYLLRDSSSLASIETPLEIRQPDMLTESMATMMYAICLVQDEASGITYMDTVTASVGRVALGNPCMACTSQDPLWSTSLTSLKEQADDHLETE